MEKEFKEIKTFKTADIWLASALALVLDEDPELILEGKVVLFAFPMDSKTLKALQDLNSSVIKFDYITYSEKFKRLKTRLFQMKGGVE